MRAGAVRGAAALVSPALAALIASGGRSYHHYLREPVREVDAYPQARQSTIGSNTER